MNNVDHYLIRSKITTRLFGTGTFNGFHNNSCFCMSATGNLFVFHAAADQFNAELKKKKKI